MCTPLDKNANSSHWKYHPPPLTQSIKNTLRMVKLILGTREWVLRFRCTMFGRRKAAGSKGKTHAGATISLPSRAVTS